MVGNASTRQYLARDDGNLCLRSPLVIAKFYQPGVAPVFGALEPPQYGAARLSACADNTSSRWAISLSLLRQFLLELLAGGLNQRRSQ